MAAAIPFAPLIMAGATVLSTVLQKTPKGASAPEVSSPTVMPTEDSAAVADAKRRALTAQLARGGRSSTILTDTDSETFGGN
jgi:hypothetical protein